MLIPEHVEKILNTFNHHSVEYLVVGNQAAVHHGIWVERTDDVELFIANTPDNIERISEAMKDFDPYELLGDHDADDSRTPLTKCAEITLDERSVYLQPELTGVRFEDAYPKREALSRASLGSQIEVPVICRDHLIEHRQACHLRELAAIEHLLADRPAIHRDHQRGMER